ncbi:ABC transporter substrate-binding protein [Chromobacterium sp. IIBBL 290-4]|uniref:substrate-binding periplasmic protein n=1 Tax=Chromobacterium sp. IIBBL 290-4 TaxID=2953890 RepID=UPI0020B6618C|nr:transporter substrate-binding domain-containing protein [Chromobacterium sp. IIBBL 290-4]UTH74941.1 transporter substrate-binding domain-containing protein [Chromobacterium sp. IIBBL 290-4]
MNAALWGGLALWLWLPALHAEAIPASSQAIEPWGDAASGDGLTPRFLRWLADQSGLQLKQDTRPLPRLIEDLKAGRDALALITASPERDAFGLELCRPTDIRLSVVYRRGDREWQSGDFKHRPVGILRGTHTLDAFLAQSGAASVLVNDMRQGIGMLRVGRLDAMMCVRPGCGHVLRQLSTPSDHWAEWTISREPMAVYVSRAHPLAHDAAALDRLKSACVSPAGRAKMAELLARYD